MGHTLNYVTKWLKLSAQRTLKQTRYPISRLSVSTWTWSVVRSPADWNVDATLSYRLHDFIDFLNRSHSSVIGL